MSSIGMSTISSKEGVGHRYSEMMFAKTQLGIYLCCRNLYRLMQLNAPLLEDN